MFTGNEDHDITLSEAAAMTKNYRESNPSNTTIAHFIGKSDLQDLLNQTGCVGVRIYYGLNDGNKELVLVGVNSDKDDLYTGKLLDRTIKCPQDCSSINPLNSNVTS